MILADQPQPRWYRVFQSVRILLLVAWLGLVGRFWLNSGQAIIHYDGTTPPASADVALPWISGVWGWGFLVFCAGTTAAAIWWQRGWSGRTSPLALIALCVVVLGLAEGAYAARCSSRVGEMQHLNVLGVAMWILLGGALLGLLALLQALFTKRVLRGQLLAICALVAGCTYAFVLTLLHVPRWWMMGEDVGVELAVATHSRPAAPFWDDPDPSILLIHAEGVAEHEPLEELAAGMERVEGYADGMVYVGIDRLAAWEAVSTLLSDLSDVKIWKAGLLTRWQEPAVATYLLAFIDDDSLAAEPPRGVEVFRLELALDGQLLLNGEAFSRGDPLGFKNPVPSHADQDAGFVQLAVDPTHSWEDVLGALMEAHRIAARFDCSRFLIGRIELTIY